MMTSVTADLFRINSVCAIRFVRGPPEEEKKKKLEKNKEARTRINKLIQMNRQAQKINNGVFDRKLGKRVSAKKHRMSRA